ncbi:MAG: glycosyltransferase [Pseudomonadota bacterium]
MITCRRIGGLRRLLLALFDQDLLSCGVEILVVDNDPEGSAEIVVSELRSASPVPLTYLIESKPGIVYARNKCVDFFLGTENHDALVFIDDDEWPAQSDWIENLVNTWINSDADIVTGHVRSVGSSEVPAWALEVVYGPSQYRPGQAVGAFYTNNVLISRNALKTVSPAFDHRFAMTGASDYHFSLRCARAGLRAEFVDAPVVEEFPPERAKLLWFLRRGFRSGSGYTRSHVFEEGMTRGTFRAVFMGAGRAVSGFILCLRGVFTFKKSSVVKGVFRIASSVGTVAGLFGLTYEEYRRQHTGGSASH